MGLCRCGCNGNIIPQGRGRPPVYLPGHKPSTPPKSSGFIEFKKPDSATALAVAAPVKTSTRAFEAAATASTNTTRVSSSNLVIKTIDIRLRPSSNNSQKSGIIPPHAESGKSSIWDPCEMVGKNFSELSERREHKHAFDNGVIDQALCKCGKWLAIVK